MIQCLICQGRQMGVKGTPDAEGDGRGPSYDHAAAWLVKTYPKFIQLYSNGRAFDYRLKVCRFNPPTGQTLSNQN